MLLNPWHESQSAVNISALTGRWKWDSFPFCGLVFKPCTIGCIFSVRSYDTQLNVRGMMDWWVIQQLGFNPHYTVRIHIILGLTVSFMCVSGSNPSPQFHKMCVLRLWFNLIFIPWLYQSFRLVDTLLKLLGASSRNLFTFWWDVICPGWGINLAFFGIQRSFSLSHLSLPMHACLLSPYFFHKPYPPTTTPWELLPRTPALYSSLL